MSGRSTGCAWRARRRYSRSCRRRRWGSSTCCRSRRAPVCWSCALRSGIPRLFPRRPSHQPPKSMRRKEGVRKTRLWRRIGPIADSAAPSSQSFLLARLDPGDRDPGSSFQRASAVCSFALSGSFAACLEVCLVARILRIRRARVPTWPSR